MIDRRPSIEVLEATRTPSILITGHTQFLLHNSLTCLVGLNLVLWEGRMLDPQFTNRSKFANGPVQFANGQSSCIGRNIYIINCPPKPSYLRRYLRQLLCLGLSLLGATRVAKKLAHVNLLAPNNRTTTPTTP